MSKQCDLFRESKPFPEDLFEAEKFDAVRYFKERYSTYDNHFQRLRNTKVVTDELSKNIAQEILDNDSIDRIEDLESTVKERVDIEISQGIVRQFFIDRAYLFKEESFEYIDMYSLLRNRKQRIENVELDEMSPSFREKIETAIAFCKMIDEEIAGLLELDLYD